MPLIHNYILMPCTDLFNMVMVFYCLIFGQNVDHAYYISKIYGPGDRAGGDLWVDVGEMGEEWKVRGFLSSAHRQAEVPAQQSINSVLL